MGAGGGSAFFGGAFGTNLGLATPAAFFGGSSLLITKLDGGRGGGRSAIVHVWPCLKNNCNVVQFRPQIVIPR
jgi:hypothetical protein